MDNKLHAGDGAAQCQNQPRPLTLKQRHHGRDKRLACAMDGLSKRTLSSETLQHHP